jgi:hypothetical protein
LPAMKSYAMSLRRARTTRASTRVRILLLTTLLAAAPGSAKADTPHPEPRVIVKVTSVQGPHDRADVERSARLAWGRIVRCYVSSVQRERGLIHLELAIARGGKVTRARRIGSTLKDRELVSCLTNALNGIAMPKASARSSANAEIHVAPGDPAANSTGAE